MPSPASTLPRLHLLASVPRRYHPTTSITTTSSYNSSIRLYSATAQRSLPTALARAGRAADLRSHPESGFTQEKLPDVKGMHHWDEGHATESEADVSV
ncbi:uncharacterized protein HMPREF1541_05315 [Cyphellophora europaea CBS 101466]|uniref:Uncharacterized protein n=1 Tax=Cyphellophora europaea (strain CBS 101466) TaxID=1220924 RepID=W2RTM1_CYPE1|nr:uncharacterized protein HMPREF1541_05315 [Cyphellophora europaea CBS 101466]ETN39093.1 hypothetical protein HMPREF1541_05315 [Cyphellophora europaea CBS 101466]